MSNDYKNADRLLRSRCIVWKLQTGSNAMPSYRSNIAWPIRQTEGNFPACFRFGHAARCGRRL